MTTELATATTEGKKKALELLRAITFQTGNDLNSAFLQVIEFSNELEKDCEADPSRKLSAIEEAIKRVAVAYGADTSAAVGIACDVINGINAKAAGKLAKRS